MKITIQKAEPKNADELTLIAHVAKRYWGYPENWIQKWAEELTVTKEFIQKNQVFVASKSKKITGFYAGIIKSDKMSIEHFWVLPEFIGKGIGAKLFQHAIKIAGSNSTKWIEIVSDPNAAGFYEKMGTKKIGEVATNLENIERRLPMFKFTL